MKKQRSKKKKIINLNENEVDEISDFNDFIEKKKNLVEDSSENQEFFGNFGFGPNDNRKPPKGGGGTGFGKDQDGGFFTFTAQGIEMNADRGGNDGKNNEKNKNYKYKYYQNRDKNKMNKEAFDKYFKDSDKDEHELKISVHSMFQKVLA